MRRAVLFVVMVASLLAAPVAFASIDQGLKVELTPSKAGTKKKPKAASINVIVTSTASSDEPPYAVKHATIYFGKGVNFNPSAVPTCTEDILNAQGTSGCPAKSKVGSGSVVAYAPALGVTENLTVTAFNGPNQTLNLFLEGSTPLQIASDIVATLEKGHKPGFPYQLDVPIPDNLQQPLTGVYAELQTFQVKVKASGKKGGKTVNYVESTGCSGGKWKFAGDFQSTNGQTLPAATTVRCS